MESREGAEGEGEEAVLVFFVDVADVVAAESRSRLEEEVEESSLGEVVLEFRNRLSSVGMSPSEVANEAVGTKVDWDFPDEVPCDVVVVFWQPGEPSREDVDVVIVEGGESLEMSE